MAQLIGPIFIAGGVLAYTGVWKNWIRTLRGYGSTMGFALFWLGLAMSLAALSTAVDGNAATALLVVAAIPLVVAVIGFFWLPGFLLPSWYRVLRGDPDAVTEAQR